VSSVSDPVASLRKFVYLLVRRSNPKIDPNHAIKILDAILEASAKRGISDEEMAEKFGFSQSEIRKTLHILYDNGLIKFRRGRHPQHGATRYYWYMDLSVVNRVLLARKKAVLEKLKRRLEYERNNEFYYCRNPRTGGINKYTLDEAFAYNFECPETEEPMEPFDNSEHIRILEEYIRALEEEIAGDEAALQAD